MLCSLKRICHFTLSHGHLSSPRWLFRSRLRAVSSLQSYSRETQVRQRRAISEGVFSRLVPIPSNITSWFAIALAEIRTRWILREKKECKRQSACVRAMLSQPFSEKARTRRPWEQVSAQASLRGNKESNMADEDVEMENFSEERAESASDFAADDENEKVNVFKAVLLKKGF